MRTKLFFLMIVFLISGCGGSEPVSPSETEPVSLPEPTATLPASATQSSIRSGDGSIEVQVTITNRSSEPVDVFWVDFDGIESPFIQLAASQSETIPTYSTHAWRIYDSVGKMLGEFITTDEPQQAYEITAEKVVILAAIPTASVEECKLPPRSFTNVGLGLPNPAFKMPSVGDVKTIILFADFSDVPATQQPEDLLAIISPGAEDFYSEMSYGKLNWTLEPYPVWLRLSNPSSYYGAGIRSYEGHLEFIQEAVTLADANVDFSSADSVVVLVPPQATAIPYGPALGAAPGAGYVADGKTFANGVTSGADLPAWGAFWLNHETGHMMGLPDLYAYQYDVNNYPDQHRFVGDFSLMGYIDGSAPGYFAFERWQLRWLEDSQIVCQTTADQTTTLTPIETEGGVKAVIIPLSENKAVVVESRRPLGVDAGLVEPGVLVYIADTSIYSGEGTIKVLPASDGDPYRVQSPLGLGESLTVEGVTVTVINSTEQEDTVQIVVTE
jgi:M6 family metalloprotease-like protein